VCPERPGSGIDAADVQTCGSSSAAVQARPALPTATSSTMSPIRKRRAPGDRGASMRKSRPLALLGCQGRGLGPAVRSRANTCGSGGWTGLAGRGVLDLRAQFFGSFTTLPSPMPLALLVQ
jgi:hypothetical protein